jgi:hypothetical protein
MTSFRGASSGDVAEGVRGLAAFEGGALSLTISAPKSPARVAQLPAYRIVEELAHITWNKKWSTK